MHCGICIQELEKLDLSSALECLVKDLTASKGPAIHLSTDGLTRRIPMEVVKALLRICQEAVSNSVKHSKAREIRIDLRFDSNAARLERRRRRPWIPSRTTCRKLRLDIDEEPCPVFGRNLDDS